MASTNEFLCIQGDTFVLALDAVEGDLTGYTCESDFKAFRNGQPLGPVVGTFSAVAVPSMDGGGPGFYLTLAGGQTKDLAPGEYVADARLVKDGVPQMTGRVVFEVDQGITRR